VKGFIGACLESEVSVESMLDVSDFSTTEEQKIFKACLDCVNAGMIPDLGTVHKKTGVPLSSLVDYQQHAIPKANFEYYSEKIREKSNLKALKELCREVVDSGDTFDNLKTLVELKIGTFHGLSEKSSIKRLSEPFGLKIAQYDEARKTPQAEKGFMFGVPGIDDITGAISGPKFCIVAARPSRGKTAIGLQGAINTARSGLPGLFLSLEMEHGDLIDRLIAAESNIGVNQLRTGHFPRSKVIDIGGAFEQLAEVPLYIFDEPNQKLSRVKSKAREAVRKYDVKFILIDYVELIDFKVQGRQRREEIGEISRQLKQLSRELKIPVILLAQLGRQADEEFPKLHDLRESGNLEQDADIVLLINSKQKDIIIAKQRQGATGSAMVEFVPSRMVFQDRKENVEK
jgi:replicative DNA helicase